MEFDKLVSEEYRKYVPPQKKPLTKFQESLYKNTFNILIEQDDVEDMDVPSPSEEPMGGGPDMGIDDAEVADVAPEIQLDNKPWNVIGYITYKSLMTDPSDIRNNEMFNKIMDQFGDIKSAADIKTPEHANKLMTAIQGVLDSIYTEEDLPNSNLQDKEF